jgi:hypothetical protein
MIHFISPAGFTAGMSALAVTLLQSETIKHRINFILPGKSGKYGENLVAVAAIVASFIAGIFLNKYLTVSLLAYNFACVNAMDCIFKDKVKLITTCALMVVVSVVGLILFK